MKHFSVMAAASIAAALAACGGGDDPQCTPLADYLRSIGQAPYSLPLPPDARQRGEWRPPFLLVWKDPNCKLCSLPEIEGPYYDPAAIPPTVCKESP